MVTTFEHLSFSEWSSASPKAGSGNTMISALCVNPLRLLVIIVFSYFHTYFFTPSLVIITGLGKLSCLRTVDVNFDILQVTEMQPTHLRGKNLVMFDI